MAHYVLRNQLHFQRHPRHGGRRPPCERWHELTQQHGAREVALIADASNQGDRPSQRPRATPPRRTWRTRPPRALQHPDLPLPSPPRRPHRLRQTAPAPRPVTSRERQPRRNHGDHPTRDHDRTSTDQTATSTSHPGAPRHDPPWPTPTRLPPARRDRRALRCPHRRLANKQGEVPTSRPPAPATAPTGTSPATNSASNGYKTPHRVKDYLPTYAQQPHSNPIPRATRARGYGMGTQPRYPLVTSLPALTKRTGSPEHPVVIRPTAVWAGDAERSLMGNANRPPSRPMFLLIDDPLAREHLRLQNLTYARTGPYKRRQNPLAPASERPVETRSSSRWSRPRRQ